VVSEGVKQWMSDERSVGSELSKRDGSGVSSLKEKIHGEAVLSVREVELLRESEDNPV